MRNCQCRVSGILNLDLGSGAQLQLGCSSALCPRHRRHVREQVQPVVESDILRRPRNLCLGSLIEAVRDQTRFVDLKQVNHVLIQPHWRKDYDNPLPESHPVVA